MEVNSSKKRCRFSMEERVEAVRQSIYSRKALKFAFANVF